jgi:CelD/BcsL family acetyltransferase involved in cellulose biosynthesis
MAHAVHVRLDAQCGVALVPAADNRRAVSPIALLGEIRLTVYESLSSVEQEWRAFERDADCTVFQSFDWLATWQCHIGLRNAVTPAIVMGRDAAGNILFIFPLSVRSVGVARELAWLGSDLCDYNAPLVAANLSEWIDHLRFTTLWQSIMQCLQDHPRLRFDYINLAKMPERVGAQPNPMRYLQVTTNPNGAYLTHLVGDWETFYAAKRSATTRRRDRTKRKRLAESGKVQLTNPKSDPDMLSTLDILMKQKAQSFASMGIANLFARPGYAEFYHALATDPATKNLVHLSTLNVGSTVAAANLGLTYRNCYYHLLASYNDGDLSRFGPGAAHLHDLMRFAIEHGYRIFDFTIGDERYKRDWCDTELKLYDYVSAVNWRGALFALPMLAIHPLKVWIKQTPMAWSAFRMARTFIASLTSRR